MSAEIKYENPIHVLVVDDNAAMRSLVKRILGQDSDIMVVSSAVNVPAALGQLSLHDVDIILLDAKATTLDNKQALHHLVQANPEVKIIMIAACGLVQNSSCLTALEQGAVDYILKPSGTQPATENKEFQESLISKIKHWGDPKRSKRQKGSGIRFKPASLLPLPVPKQIIMRTGSIGKPDCIAIGSSTGGPRAVLKIIPHLKDITQPVFLTQHMPAAFTPIMAEHINDLGILRCVEAKDRMRVEPATIYLAPGDFHMTVEKSGTDTVVRLNQNAPENFCRPAVDPMLRSLAAHYGNKLFIVILTGMGVDGQKGGEIAIKAGASMIAQDEASSVVWGMPAAVAHAGLCHAILPLDDIGPQMAMIARKGQV